MPNTNKRHKIVALLSKQGTACYETTLYNDEDTPENRTKVEREYCHADHIDPPIAGTWTDVSDNEALQNNF